MPIATADPRRLVQQKRNAALKRIPSSSTWIERETGVRHVIITLAVDRTTLALSVVAFDVLGWQWTIPLPEWQEKFERVTS